jgi:hypothetical protein
MAGEQQPLSGYRLNDGNFLIHWKCKARLFPSIEN